MLPLFMLLATLSVYPPAKSIIVINGTTDHQQENFTIGTDLHFRIANAEDADSVKMWMDNFLVDMSGGEAVIHTTKLRMGLHQVHAHCYKNGSIRDTLQRHYILVSDIIPVRDTFEIVNIFPHDTLSFTQGLVYYKGFFYEGTGLHGRSLLSKVQIATGRQLSVHRLPQSFFGEGIVLLNNRIYQLTWRNKLGLIYDRASLAFLKGFQYPWDGWGITTDGKDLFISTGSNRIYIVDTATLRAKDSIDVCSNTGWVQYLNELEMIDGDIYANVFLTDNIVRIDTKTGKVKAIMNFSGLRNALGPRKRYPELNGIAYDQESGRMFVTGKMWPRIFEIRRRPMP